jgi:hypothetical protein
MPIADVRWVLDQAANKVAAQIPREQWEEIVASLQRLERMWRARPATERDDPASVVRAVVVPVAHVSRVTNEQGQCEFVQLPASDWDLVVEYLEDLSDTLAIEESREARGAGVALEDVKAQLAPDGKWRTG